MLFVERPARFYVTLWNKAQHLVPSRKIMPSTKHRVAVNLDDTEFSELAAMAGRHDVSLAWLGRQALLEFIARYRHEQLNLPLRLEARSAHGPRRDEHAAQ
jgi:hypothetical protein